MLEMAYLGRYSFFIVFLGGKIGTCRDESRNVKVTGLCTFEAECLKTSSSKA